MKTSFKLYWLSAVLLLALLSACSMSPIAPAPAATETDAAPTKPTAPSIEIPAEASCPVTEPVWVKPPEDAAVQDTPGFGYYYLNEDSSIWASAWWEEEDTPSLRATKEGIKMGWFRPAGATMKITGRRLDADAPPLYSEIPCCYPSRFQATGLYFPTEGCWEVTAKAGGSEITFVVWVEP